MRPIVDTRITLHTLWQALTGQLPPPALPPAPIPRAVLDSRDVEPGDLFIALKGPNADGHDFVDQALNRGAGAIICEPHARDIAETVQANVIDTTGAAVTVPDTWHDDTVGRLAGHQFVFVVDDSVHGLQRTGGFQRFHRTRADLKVIGITGSIGKTSTKELAAAVLRQHYCTLHNIGNLNSEQGLPLTLLQLGQEHERAVLEMAMYAVGDIHELCQITHPTVGVITNVGPSHLGRLGTIERIAQAKSELVRALPAADDGGVAILNWDDELVRDMAQLTKARIFRYGLTSEADLWADEISSADMNGIRFRFHYRAPTSDHTSGHIESLHVRVPLLGRHSVHTALRAAAVGLTEGLTWEEIVAGMQSIPGQLRLVVVRGVNGSTVIDDTYNASPASTVAALNVLADLQPKAKGRRVAVLGDMLELGSYTEEGHKLVGRRAADVADHIVTVGELGRAIGEEALAVGFDAVAIDILENHELAIALLNEAVAPDDIVLVKGSRAVGMDAIVAAITQDELEKSTVGHQESSVA